jgi:hypothetical protein
MWTEPIINNLDVFNSVSGRVRMKSAVERDITWLFFEPFNKDNFIMHLSHFDQFLT